MLDTIKKDSEVRSATSGTKKNHTEDDTEDVGWWNDWLMFYGTSTQVRSICIILPMGSTSKFATA